MAARHFAIFGYSVSLCYPKQSKNEEDVRMMDMLLKQAQALGVTFIDSLPSSCGLWKGVRDRVALKESFDVVVDAIFGT